LFGNRLMSRLAGNAGRDQEISQFMQKTIPG
jgi:hypothetical protein